MTDGLGIEVHLGQDDAALRGSGPLDKDTVAPLINEIQRLHAVGVFRRISVDLRQVTQCDDEALELIRSACAEAQRGGTDVVVTPPTIATEPSG